MTGSAVQLRDLRKAYGAAAAVERTTLTWAGGAYVVLLGPSGSGKTTLLSMIGGFVEPTGGRIAIGGRDVTDLPPARRPTATVFQDYALFPHMTVHDNVAFGLKMRRVARDEARREAQAALALVGLAGFGDRRIDQLSGGQKQRVALARALVVKPRVLLLDEPLGALDVHLRRRMQDELRALQRRIGATFVHVTHDQEEAMSLADTLVVMNGGRIEDMGEPERVYRRPRTGFTASFMGDSNVLAGEVTGRAGGLVSVSTRIGPLWCDAGGTTEGETVRLSVRPADLRPRPAGQGEPAGERNVVAGRIVSRVFQGDRVRCLVAVDGDEDVPNLIVMLTGEESRAHGDAVRLAVAPDAIAVLDRA